MTELGANWPTDGFIKKLKQPCELNLLSGAFEICQNGWLQPQGTDFGRFRRLLNHKGGLKIFLTNPGVTRHKWTNVQCKQTADSLYY